MRLFTKEAVEAILAYPRPRAYSLHYETLCRQLLAAMDVVETMRENHKETCLKNLEAEKQALKRYDELGDNHG